MKEIQPCPSAEELEAEVNARFQKEHDEHKERAEDLLLRLTGKGVHVTFNAEASYSSFSTETFGVKCWQRKLERYGWEIRFGEYSPVKTMSRTWFGSLVDLLNYVENLYFPVKDWSLFDSIYDERLQTIYQLADERDQRVTIETRPEAGKMKAVVFVIKRHTDNVLHHGTFAKFSEAVASLEAFFNT